jgi:hypothetical protein
MWVLGEPENGKSAFIWIYVVRQRMQKEMTRFVARNLHISFFHVTEIKQSSA